MLIDALSVLAFALVSALSGVVARMIVGALARGKHHSAQKAEEAFATVGLSLVTEPVEPPRPASASHSSSPV